MHKNKLRSILTNRAIPLDGIEVIATKIPGYMTIRAVSKEGNLVFIHSQYDPIKETKNHLSKINLNSKKLVLIIGIGLGYHLREIIEKTSSSQKIIGIEPNLSILKLVLKQESSWDMFLNDRIEVIFGKNYSEIMLSLISYLQEIEEIKSDEVEIFSHQGTKRVDPEYFTDLEESIKVLFGDPQALVPYFLYKEEVYEQLRVELARYLTKKGDFLSALRLYYQLEAEGIKKEAGGIVKCWVGLENYIMAHKWFNYLPKNSPEGILEDYYSKWLFQKNAMERTYRVNLALFSNSDKELSEWVINHKPKRCITWVSIKDKTNLVEIKGKAIQEISVELKEETAIDIKDAVEKETPIVILGLHNPQILYVAFKCQPHMFLNMKQPIYVLEEYGDIFLLILRLFNLSEIINSGRVFWFLGENYKEKFKKHFLENFRFITPKFIFCSFPYNDEDIKEIKNVLKEVENEKASIYERNVLDINCYYSALSIDDWKKIYSNNRDRPLRVYLITSIFTTVLQYCTKDLADAFRELGCETKIWIEDKEIEAFHPYSVVHEMARFKPDMVLILDHLRYEYDIFGVCINHAIPFVCWILDKLSNLFDTKYIEKLSDRDFTYTINREFAKECYKSGYKEVKVLPVAYNPKIYHPDVGVRKEYQCDIAFVASVGRDEDQNKIYSYLMEKEKILLYYEDFEYYRNIIQRATCSLNLDLSEEYLDSLARYFPSIVLKNKMRIDNLLWAKEMELDIKLYGSGWDTIPELREYARGTIPNRSKELCSLFQSAKIHLHINLEVNVHFRVLECIASGGFILIKDHPSDFSPGGLNDFLEIGKEVITYTTKEDFQEKVLFYLNKESERQEIIEAGRKRVLRDHTYTKRTKWIIEDIKARL